MTVKVLVPASATDYESQLQRVASCGTLPPFDPVILEFINAVSGAIMKDPVMRRMPEMMAVAFWMRKAHLAELRRAFDLQRGDSIWLPRGLALHFAPSNVDSMFVYSWFVSMLVGNGNVVRLSNRRGREVDLLLAAIDSLCARDEFRPIRDRSLIISYDHDDAVTQRLSEACHVRVLWGGDESVRRLRAIPANPLASEIAFANRFSLAVLNASTVTDADPPGLAALAARFCNDAYWFDQMACSSPRLVVWIGSAETCLSAQTLFWAAVGDEIAKRGIEYPEMVGIDKLVAAYVAAATGVADEVMPGITGSVSRIRLTTNTQGRFRNIDCGGGLFSETSFSCLDELSGILTERDQTMAYSGFERDELRRFACSLPARTVDRIVPIGNALDFSVVWDGSNLFRILSREIDLR